MCVCACVCVHVCVCMCVCANHKHTYANHTNTPLPCVGQVSCDMHYAADNEPTLMVYSNFPSTVVQQW